MGDDMSAYRDVFLSESAEYLQSITDGLLGLERDPTVADTIETVFRGAHSLKGMAAAMGYDASTELTHKMEGLMDTVRKGVKRADHDLIDLMLGAVDILRSLIEAESSGTAAPDTTDLVARLAASASDDATVSSPATLSGELAAGDELRPGERVVDLTVTLESACVLKSVRAYMAIKRLSMMGEVLGTTPSAQEIEDEQFDAAFSVAIRSAESDESFVEALLAITEIESVHVHARDIATVAGHARPRADAAHLAIPKLAETQTVRISIGHLDTMVDLVGELVILYSRLEQVSSRLDDRGLDEAVEDVRRIAGDLQHEVMLTRMVPVGNIFNRFPRMVRDLARDLGKDVTFEMSGLDIELDRTVLDEIGDPLVHLLRNCVDHGIESPDVRRLAGKAERGTVRLDAARERDYVTITVSDDGGGIDPEIVWATAVARRSVDPLQRHTYSDAEILNMIFLPGFSTSAVATKVSGRGVGMDVVKGKIEHLGGSVRIDSSIGEGSQITLTLPLTLAIIQVLLCRVGEYAYALPLTAVTEVLAPDEVQLETVDGRPVFVHRSGSVLALDRLGDLLGLDKHSEPIDAGDSIVVLEHGGTLRAVVVPEIVDRQEIVIKPLAPMFGAARGLGGATVLGDGTVALIVDPRGLFASGEERS